MNGPATRAGRATKLVAAGVSMLAIGAIAASPASAGNFLGTGHDVEDHATGDGQEHFLNTALDFVRAGAPNPAAPVLVIECNDGVSEAIDFVKGAGGVPIQSNCPSADPAAFNSIGLTTGSFSALIVGSSCDSVNLTDCFAQTEDSDLLNARQADIAAFFNAGGGIFAMSGQLNGDGDASSGPDTYYNFVPIGLQGAEVNPPFCLTPEGIALGFHDQQCPDPSLHNGTFDDINCCPTHNSFGEPPAGGALKVSERDSLGNPETLFASGQIQGGGFVPTPAPSPYSEDCGVGGGVDLLGTDASETLAGTDRRDRIRARGGNDTVNGLGAADCLFGNAGNDKVNGEDGADLIRAGAGNDKVNGGDGDDNIKLQDGNDKLKAGPGDDTIKAQSRGRDKVNCGSGNDEVVVDRADKVSTNCEQVKLSKNH